MGIYVTSGVTALGIYVISEATALGIYVRTGAIASGIYFTSGIYVMVGRTACGIFSTVFDSSMGSLTGATGGVGITTGSSVSNLVALGLSSFSGLLFFFGGSTTASFSFFAFGSSTTAASFFSLGLVSVLLSSLSGLEALSECFFGSLTSPSSLAILLFNNT